MADLRRDIVEPGQPGERLASLEELARRYAVSTSSIRTALLTLAEEGLVTLRHGSGSYVAARRAQAGVPSCVGILTDWNVLLPGLGRFHRVVMDAARQTLLRQQWSARLYFGSGIRPAVPEMDHPEFEADLQGGRLRGVIAVPTCLDGRWLTALRAASIPWAHLDYAPQPGSVNLDYAGLIRIGVQALRDQGCRRLALAGYGGGPLARAGEPGWCARIFQEQLVAHGLGARRGWVQTNLQPAFSGAGWEEFREIWTAHAEKPDGLLVADDVLLPDITLAMRELGLRVPEQLRVVTHANQGLTPPLPFAVTRVEFDPRAVGGALAEFLLRRLAGELPAGAQQTLTPRVIASAPTRDDLEIQPVGVA